MSDDVRREIVRVCRRLYERGLIAGPDGNVSVRIARDHVVATPRGFSKADVEEHDLVLLTLEGTKIGGKHEASSEIAMHLAAYRARPDVFAVVHAHPPVATAFAVSGQGLPGDVLPELVLQVGEVPLVPYATPGTDALPDAMKPFLPNYDAFLLANHGVTTLGRTLLNEGHIFIAQELLPGKFGRSLKWRRAAEIPDALEIRFPIRRAWYYQPPRVSRARLRAGVPGPSEGAGNHVHHYNDHRDEKAAPHPETCFLF